MSRIGGTTMVVAALVFLASAVAFGASVVNAVRVGEVPESATDSPGNLAEPGSGAGPDAGSGAEMETDTEGEAAPSPQGEHPEPTVRVALSEVGAQRGPAYPQVTDGELLGAVNRDVFQPDRTPPLERYLLPGQRDAADPQSRNNRRVREPDLRIVGTAIAGDLALAMVQPDDSIPFAVLLGESVDGFFLAAIDEESVTLTRDGDEFVYPVVEPQRSGSSNSRDRSSRNRAATEEAAQALNERVQQMLRQLQQRGGAAGQAGPVQLRFAPNVELIQRGGVAGGRGAVTIRPPGGGGSGGGGSRP
ncbi:MAG: hypothetical protein PVJ76_05640 [Gemmatimonadota bacterium]